MEGTSPEAPDLSTADQLAGRRQTLRLLGLSGLGALAGLAQHDPAAAKDQERAQRRRERRRRREQRASAAQAEKKKKKAGTPGPTGPTGPAALAGSAFDHVPGGDPVTSSTFDDLATPGPEVTVVVPDSGKVLVILTATITLQTPTTGCAMSFETTQGTGNYSPDRSRGIAIATDSTLLDASLSAVVPLSQLSPCPHTFTAKYRKLLGGEGTDPYCEARSLVVIPLP